ncbi:short chain dehydrogenase [Microbacterium sp. AZCO]|uniref:short chain dehydrogenase n=1 Tax=Microbacterium sp. AZCO TaxID=3142976 RepID=UPI0031F42DD3
MSKRVLIVGANGLIGSRVASELEARGHEIVRASRSSGEQVDLLDIDSIASLYERIGTVDAVVAAAGVVPFKPFTELTVDDFRAGLTDKALGQIALVTLGHAHVSAGGSFTLTSGVLADQVVATGAAASAVNGALNSFVIAAATGLPQDQRINAVSPNVLLEAESYHSSFPGFVPVPAADVVQAYIRAVEGVETGRVFSV